LASISGDACREPVISTRITPFAPAAPHRDDRFRLFELLAQARMIAFELRHLLGQRVQAPSLTSPLFRRQGLQPPALALPPPRGQMACVQTFPAHYGTHLPRYCAGICFRPHTALVGCGKTTTMALAPDILTQGPGTVAVAKRTA
jgi:hypothetical protein